MIKRLHYLQAGFLTPQQFNHTEMTNRCYSLKLSRNRDLDSVHTSGVNTLDIERSENSLLSGCNDGSVYIHDLNNIIGGSYNTAKCICKILKNNSDSHKNSIECATWYGNENSIFITSGRNKILKIWDSNLFKPIEQYQTKGKIYQHDCCNASNFKPLIAVAGSLNFIELIDLRTGCSTHELRGHKNSILTCCWSPVEEYLLASGGIDKSICLWDIRSSNACLKKLDKNNCSEKGVAHSGYVNGLKFTNDGLLLISLGTDNKMRFWEIQTGHIEENGALDIKNNAKKAIQFAITKNLTPSLIFIPSEGQIIGVEMGSGKIINILKGHFHLVNCCFYRDSYQELYSGGDDHNILLWTADEFNQEEFLNDNVSSFKGKLFKNEDSWSSDDDY